MCGRYVIEDYQELSERLVQVPLRYEFDLKPNWNAAQFVFSEFVAGFIFIVRVVFNGNAERF